ncbi:Hint domain-containing protein [Ruegeria profundi]|uniref:Hint domain-containing protein n=1 Tax=Ruegeria profundi TaxID=1685378 RepID=UPI001CD3B63D|nr:Hint domain-containing protein [Ruegeria profundi]MCA0928620.1 Hint domain-containing protein [Ruegeria profundi]
MATYSYIGYAPDIVLGVGSFQEILMLDASFDPGEDRRVFNVEDEAGPGPLANGDPDNGTDFNGDSILFNMGNDETQQGTVTDIDGNNIPGLTPGGNIYLGATYELTTPEGGTINFYSVEVDGVIAGYVTSEPLVPGVAYPYVTSDVGPNNAPDTTDPTALVDVPCFVQGTLIQTPKGETAVEDLKVGDLVVTADGQAKEIRWIGSRIVDVSRADALHLRPIRIAKGALAEGVPSSDLFVSPNHRILMPAADMQLLFEEAEVLVPAKFLLGLHGVDVVADAQRVSYYHFIFDEHEIVMSNGAQTESLFPGDIALSGMEHQSRLELLELFPDLSDVSRPEYGPTAAKVLCKHEAKLLVSRYVQ